MSRRIPTGKLAALSHPSSASPPPVRLVVEYEDADDFLTDYSEALAYGRGIVQTTRVLEPGSPIQLGLSFPGLVEPLEIDAVVHTVGEASDGRDPWVEVELLDSASRLAALVPRIRERDRRVVMPVVNVLIVEDNKHVAELVKSGLAASSRRELRDVLFTFQTADDGGAALELLKHKKFDAAIIDVYLPVLDGPGLIRQMRTTLALAHLPVIALSGGGPSAQAAALRAGASMFIDKPVRLRHLIDAMRVLLKVGASA